MTFSPQPALQSIIIRRAPLKLDFDDAPFKTVKHWTLRTMKKFRLGGFIILKSREGGYHVVFDEVSWERNMHILAWFALESGNPKLQRYLTMQCIKESSTLRISPKKLRIGLFSAVASKKVKLRTI